MTPGVPAALPVSKENRWRLQLLGKRVRVTMDPDDPAAITEGTLLGFGDDGSFEIREDDGFTHDCRPMLQITSAEPLVHRQER